MSSSPTSDTNKKRKAESQALQLHPNETKKARTDVAIVGPRRTSKLQSPIVLLEGHQGEVFTVKFNPNGSTIASGSFDKTILLWNVYGNCANYAQLKGHGNAILELDWSIDATHIFSASADKSVFIWDAELGSRVKKFKGHKSFVNCISAARSESQLLVSGSDDRTAKIWDTRQKDVVNTLPCKHPVLTVCFNMLGDQIFTSGTDNVIKVWDRRKNDIAYCLVGHTDTVTGIKLSPDGTHLLSNSTDNTVRMWDIRPFVKGDRCVKMFFGIQHGIDRNLLRCSWSPDGTKISAGSSDSPTHVYIWDVFSRRILYKLPGHKSTVNEVVFHPSEPIIASASSDKTIYLGEIE